MSFAALLIIANCYGYYAAASCGMKVASYTNHVLAIFFVIAGSISYLGGFGYVYSLHSEILDIIKTYIAPDTETRTLGFIVLLTIIIASLQIMCPVVLVGCYYYFCCVKVFAKIFG